MSGGHEARTDAGREILGGRELEQIYRLLVSSVRDYAIFVLDPDGRITTWNDGAERIKGYGPSDVLGQHYRMFFPPEERAAKQPERQLEMAARDGRFEGEGWRVRKDGTRFWAHVVLTALREDGELIGYGKVTGDMTAERRARDKLRQREQQLAEAQQIAHLGSWEWTIAADRIHWSDELFRIYGLEPTTRLVYEEYLKLLEPEDRETIRAKVRRCVEEGASYVHEHRIQRRDGRTRWVQARGEAVRGDAGDVVALHGTALDITELKESEERARRLTAEQTARREAERTAQRMGFLAEASAILGATLDAEETLRTVAWLAVPSFADWCTVDLVAPAGGLKHLVIAHMDPDRVGLVEQIQQRYPLGVGSDRTIRRVVQTGEPELLPVISASMIETAAVDDDHLRMLEEIGPRSAITVPIRVRDRILGALTFVNSESDRRYGQDDLVVAQELAGRAGLAVENAQLHEAEREARQRAERANERTARLQAITAGLSEALTAEAVAGVMVREGMAATNASTGAVALIQDDGGLAVVQAQGVAPELTEAYASVPENARLPMAEAVRAGKLVLVADRQERDRRYPDLAAVAPSLDAVAFAAVPLLAGDRTLGGLSFGFPEPQRFTDDDRQFLHALGRQCAQALDRALLYETEHSAREAAEAASRAKSQFVAMMSHELRTPLSAILGYQELLAEGIVGPVTDRQKQQLDRIRASASHLRDLINQILSLSRIEAGKEEVFPEEVDISALTRDVVVLLEQEAEAQGLTMDVDVPDDGVRIETDPAKVRQILLNLISNAIKFTEEGRVAVALHRDGDELRIEVRDTGIGIAPEDRERVFQPFTQVDQSMTRRAGGSGLGLPVSRRLAHLLGGSLELADEPGPGTTFILRLPAPA